MNDATKISILVISIIAVIVIGGMYFVSSFLGSFAPPEVLVSRNGISSNRGLASGVSIEKIVVDSIGADHYPVKYTVIYSTSWRIDPTVDRRSKTPKKIDFHESGRYSWDEDTTQIRYEHSGLSRVSLDSSNTLWWLRKFGNRPVCPIEFQQKQWYFITVNDPRVAGIYFYIDSLGKEVQYFLPSGVSPI